MKSIFLSALLATFILMPCVMQAGTLENWDLDSYRYDTLSIGPPGERRVKTSTKKPEIPHPLTSPHSLSSTLSG
jgi:hypothetical protein